MGMTIAEKILAAHAGADQVTPGQYLWCKVDATSGHRLADLRPLVLIKFGTQKRCF